MRLVQTLKTLQRPFVLWPILRAIAKPFWAEAAKSKGKGIIVSRFKRQIPSWSLLLILLLGIAVGFYASTAMSQAASPGQSTNPDFTIGANPASSAVSQGGLATFTVSLGSLNGFAGSVNLNATLSPRATNVTIALNPNSVSLLTGAGTSVLTVSTPTTISLGTYTITIGGTSGRLSHNVSIFLQVTSRPAPDFLISANPASLVIAQGAGGSSAITITSVGGFSGTISLASTITPNSSNSPTLTLNPNMVTLLSGGTANAVLTISTTGGTTRGSYTVVVLGTSGPDSHTVSVSLTVQ